MPCILPPPVRFESVKTSTVAPTLDQQDKDPDGYVAQRS